MIDRRSKAQRELRLRQEKILALLRAQKLTPNQAAQQLKKLKGLK